MRLMCSSCGRRTGTNQYARQGDTCGVWIVVRAARITRKGWFPLKSTTCKGILRKQWIGFVRSLRELDAARKEQA